MLNRLRKVVNPLEENCIKGNIIPDLWAFKESPSRNSYQKNLAVLSPFSGFYCLPENESHTFQLLLSVLRKAEQSSKSHGDHTYWHRDHLVLKFIVDCN